MSSIWLLIYQPFPPGRVLSLGPLTEDGATLHLSFCVPKSSVPSRWPGQYRTQARKEIRAKRESGLQTSVT